MVIVTPKHLDSAAARYRDAARELAVWEQIVLEARWMNFAEVRATFLDAGSVDGSVVFNVRHNRYRLITVLHYAKDFADRKTQGHCYIRSFLTHTEYNNKGNWDKEFGR
jgi:mRNA interferase HigB